ncbi:DUF1194 domain-containing protein [Pseudooceanicola sp.]|uniref:DUF1194 domain-containing protein n=1 Tax=Pseudooceanicola sp. TaxID=1914328 RepID=UPI004058CF37
MKRWFSAVLIFVLWAGSTTAQCRQALLLALDVSGSVDAREYRLQLDGVAGALLNPQVLEALNAMPDAPVRMAVMEWSGPDFQRMIVPWRDMVDAGSVQAVARQLRGTTRAQADYSTAIGSAMLRGAGEMRAQPDCWRQVVDISGDGTSNVGPQPGSVDLAGVIVNGLVIGPPASRDNDEATGIGALAAYYRAYVLRGTEAFLETAQGFADFEDAMVRKLLRELQIIAVSDTR